MPIYTYRCKDCDYQFEKRQRMADDPLTQCVHCEDGKVRRVVNSVGIVFKGSGFYVTDNRSGKGKGKAKLNDSGTDGDSAKSNDGATASTNGSMKETAVSKKSSPAPKAEKAAAA